MSNELPIVSGLLIDSKNVKAREDGIFIRNAGDVWQIDASIIAWKYPKYLRRDKKELSLTDGSEVITARCSVHKETLEKSSEVFLARFSCVERTTFENAGVSGVLADAAVAGQWVNAARALLEARIRDGAIINSGLEKLLKRTASEPCEFDKECAGFVVGEVMVMAASAIAQYAYEHQIPVIFRNQIGEGEIFASMISYGYASMGVGDYCRVTSPCHSYSGWLNNRQITAWLKNEPLPHPVRFLETVCGYLNNGNTQELSRLACA